MPTACSARARASAASSRSSSALTFRIAASDYLDPLFLPELVAHLQRQAPRRGSSCCRCPAPSTTGAAWRRATVDLVIGNWLEPPGELHLGRLMSDEIVCLVGEDHPGRAAEHARLDGRALPRLPARGADAAAFERVGRRPRRDRRAPRLAGSAARHRGAQRALQPDPADGGTEPAGADHRAAVLLALCRQPAGAHRALPGGLPALDLLPALARPDPRLRRQPLAARAGARGRAQPGRPRHAAAAARTNRGQGDDGAGWPSSATCSTSRPSRPGATTESGAVRWRPGHWLLVEDGRIVAVQAACTGRELGRATTTAAG